MPFAQIQYRSLINSPLDYQARRQRFLCISITYALFFFIIGFVFMGLFLHERNDLNDYNCQQICGYLGTQYNCGYQQCCNSPGGFDSDFYYSYQYCLGDYAQTVFFIIMIIAFAYTVYEVFLIVCIMCTAPIFQPQQQVIVTQQPMVGYVQP